MAKTAASEVAKTAACGGGGVCCGGEGRRYGGLLCVGWALSRGRALWGARDFYARLMIDKVLCVLKYKNKDGVVCQRRLTTTPEPCGDKPHERSRGDKPPKVHRPRRQSRPGPAFQGPRFPGPCDRAAATSRPGVQHKPHVRKRAAATSRPRLEGRKGEEVEEGEKVE